MTARWKLISPTPNSMLPKTTNISEGTALSPSLTTIPETKISQKKPSSIKDDLKILDEPRVIGGRRAAVLALLAAIFLLFKRGFAFIARVTHMLRKFLQTKDPKLERWLKHPEIPKSIRNIIQRE
jgi:hypothetical protein